MRVVTYNEEGMQMAINLDLVTRARLYKEGSLLLHFAGGEKDTMSVGSAHAGKVWAALTAK